MASPNPPRRLYLLDAMALAYRSHFIFISRPLLNSKGQNTSAAYGFTTALLKLIEDHEIKHLAVVFDALGGPPSYRDELYAHYKANRPPMPDDLKLNLPWIKEIVEALDVPCIEVPGVEADDVIGTLARKVEGEGGSVVIVSPDKDFRQLLSPHVSIFRPAHRGESFDLATDETFRAEYGLEPEQFIDVLALMGDSSDNVPGVPGIGEKTAIKLLQEYGSVESLIEHAADLKGKKAREGLLEHAEAARMSKQLVTILTDVDVPVDWHGFEVGTHDLDAVREVFEKLEFRSLIGRVSGKKGAPAVQSDLFSVEDASMGFDFGPYEEVTQLDQEAVEYGIVRRADELPELAQTLANQTTFALDTETTSTDPMLASLVGLSFSWAEGQGVYVPTPLPDGTQTDAVLEALAPALRSDALKVGQNLKYDLLVLDRHGARVEGELFDTLLAHYLIAPEEEHNLDAIARKFLSYRMVPITALIGTGRNQRSMRDVPIEEVGPYACEDADVTLRLYPVLRAQLEEQNLLDIAERVEFPLVRVLEKMEKAGIKVDQLALRQISDQLEAEIGKVANDIYEMVGREFNIGSVMQVGEALHNPLPKEGDIELYRTWKVEVEDPKSAGKTKKQLKDERPTYGLGIPSQGKTATGQFKTDENVLFELSTEHPVAGLILDWRKLAKLKGTYADALGKLIHPETGRVHTSFNQTIAATGRLSSSNPNLQNIPVRTDMGREVRKAFVPRDGCVLLSADYVQIELRILAAMSGDEALKEAFQKGEDIHTAAAARVFGVPPEAVTRDQRRKAKEVNYGIPYGVSGWGLAQRLRSSVGEAQALIDQYAKSYPGVMRFLALEVEKAREKGYVETLLGRRRYVPAINASNRNERAFAERVAVNMPIQGTQADMIKLAMIAIDRQIATEGLSARMLLQVHDELVFEVPPAEVEVLSEIIRHEMIHALPLEGVPIEVDVDTGQNWLDAH